MVKRIWFVIISIVIILVVAGALVTVLYLLRNNDVATSENPTLSTDPAKQEQQTKPDLSLDLRACDLVTVEQVKTALSEVAADVNSADNRGFGHLSDGKAQSCVYHFSAQDTGDNRLTVTVTEFANEDSKNSSFETYSKLTKIEGIGDFAYFDTIAAVDELPQNSYTVYVFSEQKLYSYQLTLPRDADPYDTKSAQNALTQLASRVSYDQDN